MVLTYRRPGVYLSESLLINPGNTASATTVSCFVGVAGKGPLNEPTLIESWSDYTTTFGSFDTVPDPAVAGVKVLTYLPYAVYSYFQNGGRQAWIIRSAPTASVGTASYKDINGTYNGPPTPGNLTSFRVTASSTGVWGNSLKYNLVTQEPVTVAESTVGQHSVFALQVLMLNSDGKEEVVEFFSALSVTGDIAGTRKVDTAINDPVAGSRYVKISAVNVAQPFPSPGSSVALSNGVDPGIPDATALIASADVVERVEGPITLCVVGYLTDASKETAANVTTYWRGAYPPPTNFSDRSDIFVINDSAPPRAPNETPSVYKLALTATLGQGSDSYTASYTPWLKIPHPKRVGTIIDVPPGGAVMGMMARIDATVGVFRAPAGVIAGINNAVGVQTKYTETEQGDLNAACINVIRSVPGAGIAVMGGRTRKSYGADKYISARRTLIYISEVMRRSTQFAVFENNDQRLWTALRMSAERVLRPLWEAGGLAGASANQAYFIRCDGTNNNPSVVQSGEVRMDIGVALEIPAEFIIIRLTQLDSGTFTSEVQPTA